MYTHTAEFPIAGRANDTWARRLRRHAVLILLVLASVLCAVRALDLLMNRATHEHASLVPADVVTDFGRRVSHGGLYHGEVTAAGVGVGQPQRWILRLEQRNGRRLAHAGVRVRVWMPETGVESATVPASAYVGGGEYRLDDVRFTRPGWWNVALVVDAGRGVDSLAFNVRIP